MYKSSLNYIGFCLLDENSLYFDIYRMLLAVYILDKAYTVL